MSLQRLFGIVGAGCILVATLFVFPRPEPAHSQTTMSFYYRTMARASVASNGTQSNGFSDSQHTSISADGRYVVFTSLASNLVSGDTNNGTDVFVYDRTTQQTKRVSVTSAGEQSPFGRSAQPAICADGRYIAFIHSTGNLAPNIQIIVSGATPTACKHFLVPS